MRDNIIPNQKQNGFIETIKDIFETKSFYINLDQINRKNINIKKTSINTQKLKKCVFICPNPLNMENNIFYFNYH